MARRKTHIFTAALFLMLFFVFGCKKAQVDTIYPLEYFPVYPGSYWKFVDSNNDTIVHTTAPEYQRHSYGSYVSSENSDVVYVPFYNGTPIYGYSEYRSSGGYHSVGLRRLLSETVAVGSGWGVSSHLGTSVARRIIARDTSITTVLGTFYPVIVVDTYLSSGPSFYLGTLRYYAKGVGIVRMDVVSDENAEPDIYELFEYNINR